MLKSFLLLTLLTIIPFGYVLYFLYKVFKPKPNVRFDDVMSFAPMVVKQNPFYVVRNKTKEVVGNA